MSISEEVTLSNLNISRKIGKAIFEKYGLFDRQKQALADVPQNRCSRYRNIHTKAPMLEPLFLLILGLQLY